MGRKKHPSVFLAQSPEGPAYSLKTKIKWTLVVFFLSMDAASLIALAPSISVLQVESYARTTNCAETGDCEAMVSKRSGVSASLRSVIALVLAAPYGHAADVYGRKSLFLVAACGPLLTLPWLVGSPTNLEPFYLMNTLGGLMPSGSQMMILMIVDLTSAGGRFRVMSLFALANMGLAFVANLLGSLVVARIGPQGILKVSLCMTILEIAVLFFCLPETSTHHDQPHEDEDEEHHEEKMKKKEAAAKAHQGPRATSANIADVLFKSKNIDADHYWEAKAFWLYLLSELPDSIGASQFQFNIMRLFGYTPAEFGQLSSVMMFYQLFWLAAGMQTLKMFLPNEARIFQTLLSFTLASDVIFFLWRSYWAPFIALMPANAHELIPITLQALILDVTADHRQGKVLGFLVAANRLCAVLGPSIGGAIFALGIDAFGTTRWIFLAIFVILKPIAIVAASNTLLKECMPLALQHRTEAIHMTKRTDGNGWVGI